MAKEGPFAVSLIDPLALSRAVRDLYRNEPVGRLNDHEIRMSVMTEQYPWHRHPDSDETFLVVDGDLVIEFEGGEAIVRPGQLLTIPAGTVHRTRPAGKRSVNLTIERASTSTLFED